MSTRRLALMSNVTIDLVAAKMRRNFDVYTPAGYDAWIPDMLDSGSALYTQKWDAVCILLDGTEFRSWIDEKTVEEKLLLWQQAISFYLSQETEVPVFISSIDFRTNKILTMSEIVSAGNLEKYWMDYIFDIINKSKNVFFYDFKSMIADIGRNNFYSDKMWYMGNMPFSRDGIAQIAADIQLLIKRYYEAAKKVIVLDLDNTLWGGVIGEDGIEGILLSDHKEGQRFYDFQRQLLEIKKRGVLLALNSKNNIEDVKKVFDEHPFSVLKWDDFVSKKVNWNNKALNIKEMERELNLTESSFVFIDDNPVEREVVRGECPEVTVLDFPEDTTQLAVYAEQFYREYFKQARVLSEDINKTAMYLADEKRREIQINAIDMNEYIKKLEIEVDIHRIRPDEIQRTVQLCGKTNQFNLTTIRYSEKEITQLCNADNSEIFTVHTKDKYGDNGLVSVLILRKNDDQAYVDSFLMSCRVMGRNIERVIMDEVLEYCARCGVKTVIGKYILTSKNTPVRELYSKFGFEIMDKDENSTTYQISLEKFCKNKADSYARILFSSK